MSRRSSARHEVCTVKKAAVEKIKMVLIGYPKSGKTSLAAGLLSSTSGTFSVSGDDQNSVRYLEKIRGLLGSGRWPGGTGDDERSVINLRVNRGDRKVPVSISFQEYMGGYMSRSIDAFLSKIVGGDEDGALILLNPGMDMFRPRCDTCNASDGDDDGQADDRERMLSHIKMVIERLAAGNRCKRICIVATASDFLDADGCPDGVKTVFHDFVRQLEAYLSAHSWFRERWKTFFVSVTGRLEDRDAPRLCAGEENTARNPFEWIIDGVETDRRQVGLRSLLRRCVTCVLSVFVAAGVALASWYFWFDRETERKVDAVCGSLAPPLEQAILDGRASDINRLCGDLEKAVADVPADSVFFGGNRKRLQHSLSKVRAVAEKGRLAWFPLEVARIKRISVGFSPVEGLAVAGYKASLEAVSALKARLSSYAAAESGLTAELSAVKEKCFRICSEIVDSIESGVCLGYRHRMKSMCKDMETRFLSSKEVIDGQKIEAEWKMFDEEYGGLLFKTKMQKTLDGLRRESACLRTNMFARIDGHNGIAYKNAVEEFAGLALEQASEENCEKWRKRIESWAPFYDEGRRRRSEVLRIFDGKESLWRSEYEIRKFKNSSADLIARMQKATDSLDNGDNLHAVLVECGKYRMYAESAEACPMVPLDLRKKAWSKIAAARTGVLQALSENQLERISANGPSMPRVSDDDREFLDAVLKDDGALSSVEYAEWFRALEERVGEKTTEWMRMQGESCANFLKTLKDGVDAYDALKRYAVFYGDHPCAPMRTNIVARIHGLAGPAFLGAAADLKASRKSFIVEIDDRSAGVKRASDTKRRFAYFRQLCNAMKKVKCPLLRKSCWYTFASDCIDKGGVNQGHEKAFLQKYTITRLDAMLDYKKFPFAFTEIKSRGICRFCSSDGQWGSQEMAGAFQPLKKEDNGKWRTVWNGTNSLAGGAWHDFACTIIATEDVWRPYGDIEFKGMVHVCGGRSLLGSEQDHLELTVERKESRWTGDDIPKVHYRIYMSCEGLDLFDFLPTSYQLTL